MAPRPTNTFPTRPSVINRSSKRPRAAVLALSAISILLSILLSAVALAFSQAPFDLGLVAPIALVPWLLTARKLGPTGATINGIALGIAYVGLSAHWLAPALASQGASSVRALLGMLIVAFWAKGILFGALGWAAQRLRNHSPAIQAAALAGLIATGEYATGHAALGLPLLFLGHSQQSLPGVMQLAVLVGAPGLSALLVSMNIAVVAVAAKHRRASRGAGSLATALGVAWIALIAGGEWIAETMRAQGTAELKARHLLLVQPNFNRGQRWDPAFQETLLKEIADYTSRSLATAETAIDLIVWPENLLTAPADETNALDSTLQSFVDEWSVPLVTGLVRSRAPAQDATQPLYRNVATWWNPDSGLVDTVEKKRAIPLIESSSDFPGRTFLLGLLGPSNDARRVEEASSARSLVGSFVVTPALCFEILFPGEVAARRHPDSVAILNLADDSWVEDETVDRQLMAAAAFRAVEQRLPVLRVGHGGLSGHIDAYGRILETLPPDAFAYQVARVPSGAPPSTTEKAALAAFPLISGFAAYLIYEFGRIRSSRANRHRLEKPTPLAQHFIHPKERRSTWPSKSA